MPKGLYFAAVVFSFFCLFQRLISEVTKRISIKLGHTFTYDCCLKNLVRTALGISPPPLHGLGAKKPLLGTDFKLLKNISLQRNMISIIRNKVVNLQGLPYMPLKFGKLWSRNGWEWLASFCPIPKFLHWATLPAFPHGRYTTNSRQTLARVM